MNLYEFVWGLYGICMDLYGFVWICMGFVWDLYGSATLVISQAGVQKISRGRYAAAETFICHCS